VDPSHRQKKCGENGAQSAGRSSAFHTHAMVLLAAIPNFKTGA
jgi:hypothetical protein